MTPHNKAEKNQIAPNVLIPGDPQRASFVAENFFDNSKLVSDVRGELCFTGTYKGVPVSVMSSGMGGPSVGIYSWELFTVYNVKNIIRIGTSGGLQKNINVGDIVFAMSSSTDSGWAHQYDLKGTLSPVCSWNLLKNAVQSAEEQNLPYHCGMVFSSDLFSTYNALGADSWKQWANMGALVQDMETYALYCNALRAKANALSILTMTDSCVTGKSFKDEERMVGNSNMIKIALETITKLK